MNACSEPLSSRVAQAPSMEVIRQAMARGRLGQSLLLHGDSLSLLEEAALFIAGELLNRDAPADHIRPPLNHPDCFTLRPTGKMRLITADPTRDLISRILRSPQVSRRKAALVYEADRMNDAAANIFLKTLEEPPASTTILLLTERPYALLPTIRSRCLHFRFPAMAASDIQENPDLAAWLADYRDWLGELAKGVPDKEAVCARVFGLYALVVQFEAILDAESSRLWKAQQGSLPTGISDEEKIAREEGLAVGVRQQLFAAIEAATRSFALDPLRDGSAGARRALVAAVEKLEASAGLLRVNLKEGAALENFLLASLRIWGREKLQP